MLPLLYTIKLAFLDDIDHIGKLFFHPRVTKLSQSREPPAEIHIYLCRKFSEGQHYFARGNGRNDADLIKLHSHVAPACVYPTICVATIRGNRL